MSFMSVLKESASEYEFWSQNTGPSGQRSAYLHWRMMKIGLTSVNAPETIPEVKTAIEQFFQNLRPPLFRNIVSNRQQSLKLGLEKDGGHEIKSDRSTVTFRSLPPKTMIATWKEKFTLTELLLTEENPVVFITCQWQDDYKPNLWYLLYRWIVALYFCITWLLSILLVQQTTDLFQLKWLIYLTNWGYTMCTLQAFLAAAMLSVSVLARKGSMDLQNKALYFYKAYWLVNTIATDIGFGITVIYWSTIYDGKESPDVMNVFLHAMNSVMMFLDFWIIAHSFRLLHCVYSITFAFCYAIFSIIYYAAGGTSREGKNYIYPILKWENPGTSVLVCLGGIIFIASIHTFYTGLFWLRRKLHYKTKGRSALKITTVVPELQEKETYISYINEVTISDNV